MLGKLVLVSTSQRSNICADRVVLHQVLIGLARGSLLVASLGQWGIGSGRNSGLGVVIGLLDRWWHGLGRSLLCDTVILGLHQVVHIDEIRYVFLLSVRSVVEASHGVVHVLSRLVVGTLLLLGLIVFLCRVLSHSLLHGGQVELG